MRRWISCSPELFVEIANNTRMTPKTINKPADTTNRIAAVVTISRNCAVMAISLLLRIPCLSDMAFGIRQTHAPLQGALPVASGSRFANGQLAG